MNHILGYDYICIIFFYFTGINIDGYVGLGVSLVVMWAGIGIAKDTLEPLIGAPVDPQIYKQISDITADTLILIQEFIIL